MTRTTTLVAATMLAFAACTGAAAQMQVNSGHALDSNLRVGSGGYNGRVYSGAPITWRSYSPIYRELPYMNRVRPYATLDTESIRTNYDTYLNDKSYRAGWQASSGGYSSYSSSSGGFSNQGTASPSAVGAYRINGRVGS